MGLSVGPWGWHLPLGLKWSITVAHASLVYFEWTDEDVGWDDVAIGASFGMTLYGLWTPPVVKAALMLRVGLGIGAMAAPAAPVIAGVAVTLVAGDLISHAIDPEHGRKNFREFITDPAKMPERVAFAAETIYEHKIQEPVEKLSTWYVQTVDEAWDTGKRWITENNRFLTGPNLPSAWF